MRLSKVASGSSMRWGQLTASPPSPGSHQLGMFLFTDDFLGEEEK